MSELPSTYTFSSKDVDGQSLIHLINLLLGDEVVGAEVGVFTGLTFCTLLQQCPNIKTLYGIDSYKPYDDYIKEPYDGTVGMTMDKKAIEFVRFTAYHNIEYSGHTDKAFFLEMDSHEATKQFDPESLDFVFLDTYLTYEQACSDLEDWYSKVRPGGLFAGHDYHCSAVSNAIENFRSKHGITNKMSVFDSVWVWIK